MSVLFFQAETFAKLIFTYNKYNCYRVGILAHQPPDRAEFSLISINNQRLWRCGGLDCPTL